MPLKHTTETLLIFVLAVAIVITGMFMQTLPDLPHGLLPWALLFAVSALYPILLSSLFRNNRADNIFRVLHWMPSILLIFWMIFQLISVYLPWFYVVEDWYTWGWSLPAVATGFFLLIAFVFKVLRRWSSRLFLLLAAFIPFVIGGVANEYYDWTPQMTAMLWQADWWQIGGTGSNLPIASESGVIANLPSSEEKNLSASADIAEERYRDNLRTMERRKDRIEQRLEERRQAQLSSVYDEKEGIIVAADLNDDSSESSSQPSISQTSSMPSSLPSSGFGWSALILLMFALYSATLHRKSITRKIDIL